MRVVSEVAGFSQNILGAAKPFIDLAKSLHIVSVVELPADNGVGQSAENVSLFVSLDHRNWTSSGRIVFLERILPGANFSTPGMATPGPSFSTVPCFFVRRCRFLG